MNWVKASDRLPTDLKRLYFIRSQGVYKLVGGLHHDGKMYESGIPPETHPLPFKEWEWLDETPESAPTPDKNREI